MARNPDAKFSMINITLDDGRCYGCSAVLATDVSGQPAITFISSGQVTTILTQFIKEISISVDNWCPRCE